MNADKHRFFMLCAHPSVFTPGSSFPHLNAYKFFNRLLKACALLLGIFMGYPGLHASGPPQENRYDVLGKTLSPLANILLVGGKGTLHAASVEFEIKEVSGRLPKQFAGASVTCYVESPDKVKLVAPVLGEEMTVCRNGNRVWAVPGSKVEFLLSQFKVGPPPTTGGTTPLAIPITAQQAVFLPALFVLEEGGMEEVNGEVCRLLKGGLMPELQERMFAKDLEVKVWIAEGYLPRQVTIIRNDFVLVVAIKKIAYTASLPPETWQIPEGASDVFTTSVSHLERLLFVVMNALQMREGDRPWEVAK